MATVVVNIKLGHEYDVFIGRPTCWSCPESIEYSCKTREEVLIKYEAFIRSQPELINRIKKELKGCVLGCYCVPGKRCHGEVLAKIAEES